MERWRDREREKEKFAAGIGRDHYVNHYQAKISAFNMPFHLLFVVF